MDGDPKNRPGHTNYDWINGMRVGIVVGATLGILLGWVFGSINFIWLVAGGAAGGFIGARTAHRW